MPFGAMHPVPLNPIRSLRKEWSFEFPRFFDKLKPALRAGFFVVHG